MRKLILSAFFLAAGTALFAQNFDDVQEKIKKGKFDEAREKLDKMSGDAKAQNSSEYWYYKAKVYDNLAKAKHDSVLLAGSLDAIKKYFDLELKGKEEAKRGLLSVFDNHQTAFDIYSSYFQNGVNNFKSENWSNAYYNFAKTLDAFDVLVKNKLTTATFDTTATLYAGYSAQNAKQPDEAAKYYAILADKKIADTSYIGLYEYLISYYQQKNDAANADKYLTEAKAIFPNRPNWLSYELRNMDKDKSKKLAKLEEMTQQNKNNFDLWNEYAFELFNYTYGSDKPADYAKRQDELTTALQTLISIDPSSAYANYVMSQHVSNQIYDLQQQYAAIKSTKPEDVKKKQQLNKEIDAKYETLFKYANASAQLYEKMPTMKQVEKINYKRMLTEVANYYRMKKQLDKAKIYEDKAKAAN